MGHLRVKNFEKYQHYKDRRPPWIKLYIELLEHHGFATLPDAAKWHLIAIWLLASRYENRVPNDAVWIAGQIGAASPVDLSPLISGGFLEHYDGDSIVLATCAVSATSETERETEKDASAVAAGPAERTTDPAPARRRRKPSGDHQRLIDYFTEGWQEHFGAKYAFRGHIDGPAAGRILRACDGDLDRAMRLVSTYLADDDDFLRRNGHTLALFGNQLNRYVANGAPRVPVAAGPREDN